MTAYFVDLKFITAAPDADELEGHLENVMDHLHDLDGVIDPDLTARLSTGEVTFSVGIEADDPPHALRDALGAVRTAIHACNGSTPGWENMFHEVEQSIRPDDAPGVELEVT